MINRIFSALLSLSALTGVLGDIPDSLMKAGAAEDNKKLIALTFDDGPNTTTTNDILDILAEYDAKASFFLIGDNINAESSVSVRRAYDMGMEINNHSKTHSNMSKMSAGELRAEISFVDDKVKEITGEPTKFFRPPFIDVSQSMYDAIDLPFICGIDCQDYMANVTAQERADYILNGAKDGVIVLLHDAAGNQNTVDALKIVMPQLVEQGYEFVTLTELFERQGETPKHGILYSNVAKYPGGYSLKQAIPSDTADKVAVDTALLKESGDRYAIEVEYTSPAGYPPVVALQKWSGSPTVWQTVQPFYFNGEKALFLAEDIAPVLEQLGVDYTDLDGISITAYSGEITLSNAKLLTRAESSGTVKGDVNADGVFDVADAVSFQKWLLASKDTDLPDIKAADVCEDGELDIFDLIVLKKMLLTEK